MGRFAANTDECKEILKLYESGMTYQQLQEETGLSMPTLRKAVVRAGGNSRPRSTPLRGIDMKLARKLAPKVTSGKMTVAEYAAELNCDPYRTGVRALRMCGGRTSHER